VSRPIVALAGGVGAARFLDGLARVVDPARLWIIGNTADDTEMHGLHISPDLDTVAYTLAGIANTKRWPSLLTFFHCGGFPTSGPGNLNRSLGVPACNAGFVVMSTAMTSQSRVI